jgi:hypothetical protein
MMTIEELAVAYELAKGYRKCPICSAEIGEPCKSMSARVVDGYPDGVQTLTVRPHGYRKRRAGYPA